MTKCKDDKQNFSLDFKCYFFPKVNRVSLFLHLDVTFI